MPELGTASAGNLREYLRIVRRRGWVIVLAATIAAGGAYMVSKGETPIYQAQAEVLLRGQTLNDGIGASAAVNIVSIGTELRVVQGQVVQQAVRKALPKAVRIHAAAVTGSDSFTVAARSADPKLAATTANAYVTTYVAQRQASAVNNLLSVSQQIQAKIADLQHQIDALGPVAPPAPLVNGQPQRQSDADIQRTALQNQQITYRIQLNQLQVQLPTVTAGAQILSAAVVPTRPVAPKPVRTAGEAAGGGLIVGIGLAFLMEHLDDTIKSSEMLERLTGNIPVLGVVPSVSGWRKLGNKVIAEVAPSSPASEAYRYLRTSVRFLGLDRPVGVIHITSPSSRDGKTTTVANLAVVLAQAGEKVVIVDCDLRRPHIHALFDMSNDIGFTSVLLGEVPVSAALQSVPGIPGLAILATGPVPPNPSELLSSSRAAETIATLRDSGWILIVDSPPLLPVSDACVVSTMADATLMVASAGMTTKKEIHRAVELLSQVNAPLLGTVLNRASTGHRYSYGGRYGRYGGYGSYGSYGTYTATPAKAPPRRSRAARQATDPAAEVSVPVAVALKAEATGSKDQPVDLRESFWKRIRA